MMTWLTTPFTAFRGLWRSIHWLPLPSSRWRARDRHVGLQFHNIWFD